jgi:hypothetical protein
VVEARVLRVRTVPSGGDRHAGCTPMYPLAATWYTGRHVVHGNLGAARGARKGWDEVGKNKGKG